MSIALRLLILVALVALWAAPGPSSRSLAKPAPSPSPSPTAVPTPYMPVEQVPNGTWEVIMQPQNNNITYSHMKLVDVGTTVTGTWQYDKKTVFKVTGTRDGSHLKLDLKRADKPDVVAGTIDATIDGIADMFGTITLGGIETPFQGAQHSRVPPPVEATSGPLASPTPY